MKFYFTFTIDQLHWLCSKPVGGQADLYEIEAADEYDARAEAARLFGPQFCTSHTQAEAQEIYEEIKRRGLQPKIKSIDVSVREVF